MTENDKKLYAELMSEKCVCGNFKASKTSHCRLCYFSLPEQQRRALYRRIGNGYAEAYADSVVTLKEKGLVL